MLWMLLEQHPLCHRVCKVTKETSGANKIVRNTIDLTSVTFRWTSSSSRLSVFFRDSGRVSTITKLAKMAASRRGMFVWSKLSQNLSEMDVRTFARIKKVIWDQLLASKAEIIQS